MVKTIKLSDNSTLKISNINSKITFIFNDNNIIYEGIPFNDVYDFTDVEIQDNKILLTCLIQQIERPDKNTTIKKLVPIVREFDTSLFDYSEVEESEPESEPEVEPEPDSEPNDEE